MDLQLLASLPRLRRLDPELVVPCRSITICGSGLTVADKYVAAICAAPMALAAAGITKGRRVTSYPADEFKAYFGDADYVDDELVVVDGHLITSRGPATAFLFAYTLTDILGGDSKPLMQSMLVNMAAAKIRTMDI